MEKSVAGGEYNYRRFVPAEYDYDNIDAVEAGDRYTDADVFTLTGEKVRLSAFLDKPLVLETGSMTCPMYAKSAGPMQEYTKRYPDFNFVVLYVREAHPGEKLPAHRSVEEKLAAARRTSLSHGEHRTVLADQLSGVAHRQFGNMPNSLFVIDTDGTVLFRSVWNNTNELDAVLTDIANGKKVEISDMKPVPPGLRGPGTLLLGGWVAVWDFFRGLPELLAKHRRAGNL